MQTWPVARQPRFAPARADRTRLATTTTEGLLRIWNLVVAPPPIRHEYAQRAEFHPDGRRLLISGDFGVKLWDAQRDTSPSFATGSQLYHAAFSPDGRLASASGYAGHGEVKVWDATLWENKSSGGR